MKLGRRRNAVMILALAVAFVVLVFVPAVQYSVAFRIPDLYSPGVSSCPPNANQTLFKECEAKFLYPGVMLQGRASVTYALTGLGYGPFPSDVIVPIDQANISALVHFQGAKIAYYEWPFPLGATLNPQSEVRVSNASIVPSAFGLLNFSAKIVSISSSVIWNLRVGFNYPTYGMNETQGNMTRFSVLSAKCSYALMPSSTCTASMLLPQSATLLTDQVYPLRLEVYTAYPKASNSDSFVFLYETTLRYPGVGLNPHWVQTFISAVNQIRNSTPLAENSTLDRFAAFRYNTLRAQYQISDYNFSNDYKNFFGGRSPVVFEEILYPGGRDPATFPQYLHQHAIGHWSGLMDSTYTKFGYFFGTGPTVVVGPGCSATEIPGPNINITQYVINHGCDYVVADQIWFIIILGA